MTGAEQIFSKDLLALLIGLLGAGGGGLGTYWAFRSYLGSIKEKAEEAHNTADIAIKGLTALQATCPVTHQNVGEQLSRIEGLLQGVGDQHRQGLQRVHNRLDLAEVALARLEERQRATEARMEKLCVGPPRN